MPNFKRVFIITLLMSLLSTTFLPYMNQNASAANLIPTGLYSKDLSIIIDGESFATTDPVLISNGMTLLPMRAIFEALDAQVLWNKEHQRATAIREGKTIELIINQETATVNNERFPLVAPSIMHKNRTYVPLRFVSEQFGGLVSYSHEAQTVTIRTPKEKEKENVVTKPFTLHLNNQRLNMDQPPIIRNGRTYIPAKYFTNHIEQSMEQWISPTVMDLQIQGLVFTFESGKPNILVNQEPTDSTDTPFMIGNDMYVPVHFIVNALGGSLRFRSETNEIYIYLNQFMFFSDFLPKQEGPLGVPALIPEAAATGNRQLLISDNPETLRPNVVPKSSVTLSEHVVTSEQARTDHRVFGWHVNELGKIVHLGITIENTGQSAITLPASTGYTKKSNNTWVNYDVGLPIADAVLHNRLQQKTSQGTTVNPGKTALIDSFTLHPDYIIGFLNDLTVEGTNASYTIRTVLSEEAGALTAIHDQPLPINERAAHPRGAWPHSTIEATFPVYSAGSAKTGYSISNRQTDHLLTADNSFSKTNGSVGNPGHFGMTYKVNVPIVNDTGTAQVVRMKATGRGGLYSGAIKINGDIHLIPTIKAAQEYVDLIDYVVMPGEDLIEIEVMHAGGASLPLALYIETIQ
ncbi:copper amine oxidase N-terminal domain-containing protein [Alkalihalophilus pseudofirmus]|uniref:copper amine oxidase N-terminal domain-containing protein n=1 Tax=Alkalihalophilus pseudofirmus TaxID=79885 RepID=UPI00259BAAEB|nr:copper amine oxidase N-terminal domain-containing protein [Alkalihalophilus pseudofirmus]WEG16626.1 copper amine oxidase N-terminal domain-containing protein [Alkalihalophilus pseudofirmus]